MGDDMNLLICYTISGIIFVTLFGTLSHFFYDWSGNNLAVGLFSPVNESIWEHIKLLFFPMLFYSFFMNFQLKQSYPGAFSGLLCGILVGSALIPVLFYTYSGILGFHTLTLDILTFILSVAIAFLAAYKLSITGKAMVWEFVLKAAVLSLTAAFFCFTVSPPDLGLFQDPAG